MALAPGPPFPLLQPGPTAMQTPFCEQGHQGGWGHVGEPREKRQPGTGGRERESWVPAGLPAPSPSSPAKGPRGPSRAEALPGESPPH